MRAVGGLLIVLAALPMTTSARDDAASRAFQAPRGFPQSRLTPPAIPYPESLNPEEVRANLLALVRQRTMLSSSSIADVFQREADIELLRVIPVNAPSMSFRRYTVAELAWTDGRALANIALTGDGHIINIEDLRMMPDGAVPRAMDLADATAATVSRLGKTARDAHYVYFHNTAESGISFCRPLVEVQTDSGSIYLNSRRQAFVATGTSLAAEFFGESIAEGRGSAPASVPNLRLIQ